MYVGRDLILGDLAHTIREASPKSAGWAIRLKTCRRVDAIQAHKLSLQKSFFPEGSLWNKHPALQAAGRGLPTSQKTTYSIQSSLITVNILQSTLTETSKMFDNIFRNIKLAPKMNHLKSNSCCVCTHMHCDKAYLIGK